MGSPSVIPRPSSKWRHGGASTSTKCRTPVMPPAPSSSKPIAPAGRASMPTTAGHKTSKIKTPTLNSPKRTGIPTPKRWRLVDLGPIPLRYAPSPKSPLTVPKPAPVPSPTVKTSAIPFPIPLPTPIPTPARLEKLIAPREPEPVQMPHPIPLPHNVESIPMVFPISSHAARSSVICPSSSASSYRLSRHGAVRRSSSSSMSSYTSSSATSISSLPLSMRKSSSSFRSRISSQSMEWEPDDDPDCAGYDHAAEVWKRLDGMVGRIGSIRQRGQWVAKQGSKSRDVSAGHGHVHSMVPSWSTLLGMLPDARRAMSIEGSELDDVASDVFTISDYYDAADTEAVFDMSGPLVASRSITAVTPANTPLLCHESLQRSGRVSHRRESADDIVTEIDFAPRSPPLSTIDEQPTPRCQAQDSTPKPGCGALERRWSMYRLDSQVVHALRSLGESTSPELDSVLALALSSPSTAAAKGACLQRSPSVQDAPLWAEEGAGLGLGLQVGITESSTYSLPVSEPRWLKGKGGSGLRGEAEMVQVTCLDTGEKHELGLADLARNGSFSSDSQ